MYKSSLVGFDFVKGAPPYDSSEITFQLAAKLIIDIQAARFPSRQTYSTSIPGAFLLGLDRIGLPREVLTSCPGSSTA